MTASQSQVALQQVPWSEDGRPIPWTPPTTPPLPESPRERQHSALSLSTELVRKSSISSVAKSRPCSARPTSAKPQPSPLAPTARPAQAISSELSSNAKKLVPLVTVDTSSFASGEGGGVEPPRVSGLSLTGSNSGRRSQGQVVPNPHFLEDPGTAGLPRTPQQHSGRSYTPHYSHSHAPQDPVDAYLVRYQVHRDIRSAMRHAPEHTARVAGQVEQQIKQAEGAMPRPDSPLARLAAAAAAAAADAAGVPHGGKEGAQLQGSPGTAGAGGGSRPGSAAGQRHEQDQLPPPSRSRFVPSASTLHTTTTSSPPPHRPPSASPTNMVAAMAAVARRPLSAVRPSSPGTAGGGGGGGGGAAAVPQQHVGVDSPTRIASPHPHQGAYLSLPDYSFAGSPPFKAVSTQDGVLFERYNRHEQLRAELPDLQLRYLRPPGVTAPQQPRKLTKVPKQQQPPARALPNGIPASRLERLSARRRSHSPSGPHLPSSAASPPRTHLPADRPSIQPPCTPPGLTAIASDLFRTAPPGSPTGALGSPSTHRSKGAPLGSPGGGGPPLDSSPAAALAQYLATPTAPGTGEPLLDEGFYDVLQQHFKSSLMQQTQQLRSRLNVSLPVVLQAMNCVGVEEGSVGGRGGGGKGTGTGGGRLAR